MYAPAAAAPPPFHPNQVAALWARANTLEHELSERLNENYKLASDLLTVTRERDELEKQRDALQNQCDELKVDKNRARMAAVEVANYAREHMNKIASLHTGLQDLSQKNQNLNRQLIEQCANVDYWRRSSHSLRYRVFKRNRLIQNLRRSAIRNP